MKVLNCGSELASVWFNIPPPFLINQPELGLYYTVVNPGPGTKDESAGSRTKEKQPGLWFNLPQTVVQLGLLDPIWRHAYLGDSVIFTLITRGNGREHQMNFDKGME